MQFSATDATYTAWIYLYYFNNYQHEHILYEEECGLSGWNWVCNYVWNDYCCESYGTSGCSAQCDNYFKLCMRGYGDVFNDDITHCPLGSEVTNHIMNSDSIFFSDSIGGTPNPIRFAGTVWPVSLHDIVSKFAL